MSDVVVPYVALGIQARRVKPALMAAVERVIDHGIYILGPETTEFERRFAQYCGTRYAVGVADGTSALILVLRALGIGRGDEIVTAPNSFIASAASAALLGATPRFADVGRHDMNLDPGRLEEAITPRTKAIVVVHLTGQAADMDAILKVAERHGIPVVEDAAQAVGSTYHDRKTGSMGAAGCFSLHPLKNLHAIGDAGIVTTNDEKIHAWLVQGRNHGLRTRDESAFWSTNSRLDTLQAAVLGVMLDHLDTWIAERRAIAAEYCAALRDVVGVPDEVPGTFHSYQTFMIRAERREALLAHLKARGVDAKVHYPVPIHRQPAAQGLGYGPDDFPVASWLAERIVSLPLYPELTAAQRAAVIDGVRSFYRL